MTRPRIGIALGSGGARGWCHIGVLRALIEAGLEPYCIAGCSMGSFVGAAYLTGGLDELETSARALNWRTIAGFLDVSFTRGGLIDGRRIPAMLGSANEATVIESLGKPFTAVATDLASGREVWLQSGSLLDSVRASIALPGILSPARIDGRWLLDGGMTNPVPVSACRAMGAEVVIAVNPNAHKIGGPHETGKAVAASTRERRAANVRNDVLDQLLKNFPNGLRQALGSLSQGLVRPASDAPSYFDVLSSSISIMTDQIMRSRLAGEPPHVLVRPHLTHMTTLDFHRAAEAIQEGHRAMMAEMPYLQETLGRDA